MRLGKANYISGLCDLGLEQLRSRERGDEGEQIGDEGRLLELEEDWRAGDELESEDGRVLEEEMGTSLVLEEGWEGWEGVDEGDLEEVGMVEPFEVILGDEGLLELEDSDGSLDLEMVEAILDVEGFLGAAQALEL